MKLTKIFYYITFIGFVLIHYSIEAKIDITSLHFNSIYGTTGNILTPDAHTVGKFKGNIQILENFNSDNKDSFLFNFGVHEKIEIGIQSEIPSISNPKSNIFFKFRANNQGEYFGLESKFIPITAFGINSYSSFAAGTFEFKYFNFSMGYNFSNKRQSLFNSLSMVILKHLKLQIEYVKKYISTGLRIRYYGITTGFLYSHKLFKNHFDDRNAFWEISYNY